MQFLWSLLTCCLFSLYFIENDHDQYSFLATMDINMCYFIRPQRTVKDSQDLAQCRMTICETFLQKKYTGNRMLVTEVCHRPFTDKMSICTSKAIAYYTKPHGVL